MLATAMVRALARMSNLSLTQQGAPVAYGTCSDRNVCQVRSESLLVQRREGAGREGLTLDLPLRAQLDVLLMHRSFPQVDAISVPVLRALSNSHKEQRSRNRSRSVNTY